MNVEDGAYEESDEASNDGSFQGSNVQRQGVVDSTRSSEGVLAPTNWKSTSMVGSFGIVSDGPENEKKIKKVKLKVGGVTRTIDAKSVSDGASGVGSSSTKASHFPDAPRSLRRSMIKVAIRQGFQDNSDDHSFTSEKESTLRRVPWKDFSKGGPGVRPVDHARGRIPSETTTNETDKHEPVRKKHGEDGGRKQRRVSKVVDRNVVDLYELDVGDYGSSRMGKEAKKSRSGRTSEDTDYVEDDEESVSDVEPENRRKKAKKEIADFLGDSKKEMTVTTRQRAQQAGKDISSTFGVAPIEFPNGLPPAPPKKQKEKLSEVEQQLKKAEAAQKRRMQVEKAARESEAEAIRKILGQDSSRKKREDKIKRRQEEMAQEKATNSMILGSDIVRWVMGPSGTVVTFPSEVGLPSIFDCKPCGYPPPREKCAAPSCTNPYKYRDSKSKLPLCSLQCYKAIREKMSPLTAC
ncbi:PAPA-1-like conserved region [Corchorus olitorius]|uniref:PAPA-1-like conserved region n=1 Tax=Corchorus olitorius TaxID=93759 RepID=A0A1R3KQN8_9ROSI|nr:PAPA-1-like conserved region [Corchorus olitorius]